METLERLDQGCRLEVLVGDLAEAVEAVEPESADLVFTSPPYKAKDGWSRQLMEACARAAGRALKPGGRLFVVFGQLRSEGFGVPYETWNALFEAGRSEGLVPGQTIAWAKSVALPSWRAGALERVRSLQAMLKHGVTSDAWLLDRAMQQAEDLRLFLEGPGEVLQRGHYQAIHRRSPTLNYCWEPIYTFSKPPEGKLDRLAIGCPFADKSNLARGTRGRDGDVHCAGDVWFVPYKTTGHTKKKATAGLEHSYGFPEELALRAIRLCGVGRDGRVFDPFLGGGTTACAAKRVGAHAVGVELHRAAAEVALAEWQAVA